MRVDATQNVSRIDGVYVYPVRRYHSDPVPSVDPVRERQSPPGASRLREQNYLELYSPSGMRRVNLSSGPSLIDRWA
jgi:hypothetical protein